MGFLPQHIQCSLPPIWNSSELAVDSVPGYSLGSQCASPEQPALWRPWKEGARVFRAGLLPVPFSSMCCLLTWTPAHLQWRLPRQPLLHHHFPELGPLGSGERVREPVSSGSPILAMTLTTDALPPPRARRWAGPLRYSVWGQPGLEPRAQSCPFPVCTLGFPGLSLPAVGSPLTLRALLPSDRSPDEVRTKVGVVVPLGPCFLEPVPCQGLQLPGVCQ